MLLNSSIIKTFIKILQTFIAVVLLFPFVFEECKAQESSKRDWIKRVDLNFGYALASNDWKYAYPSYSPTGAVTMLNETGSFKSKSIYNGQFELSKGYFGFNFGAVFFPGEIKIDKSVVSQKLTSYFLEIEGLLFPLENPLAKLVHFLQLGVGGYEDNYWSLITNFLNLKKTISEVIILRNI